MSIARDFMQSGNLTMKEIKDKFDEFLLKKALHSCLASRFVD